LFTGFAANEPRLGEPADTATETGGEERRGVGAGDLHLRANIEASADVSRILQPRHEIKIAEANN
jgi:hypothetical protein